jgi:hypothetical protein
MSSTSSQFSRLAICSRVFYEREIIEQRNEIEALKLKLFWKEYGINQLQRAMICEGHRYRRLQPNKPHNTEDWYSWMGPLIKAHDLEVETFTRHPENTPLPTQIDLNVHFGCRFKYFVTSYGSKLWKATSVDDPELRKLKALFHALNSGSTI